MSWLVIMHLPFIASHTCIWQESSGVPQDLTKAMNLFRQSAERGFPPGLLYYGVLLHQEGQVQKALVQFEKGTRLEEYLNTPTCHDSISKCQFMIVRCLIDLHEEEEGRQDNLAKDIHALCTLLLFWACKAAENGLEEVKKSLQSMRLVATPRVEIATD